MSSTRLKEEWLQEIVADLGLPTISPSTSKTGIELSISYYNYLFK